jgi:hypothetical protein
MSLSTSWAQFVRLADRCGRYWSCHRLPPTPEVLLHVRVAKFGVSERTETSLLLINRCRAKRQRHNQQSLPLHHGSLAIKAAI